MALFVDHAAIEERKERALEGARAYALASGDERLARSAQEGYPVGELVAEHVRSALERALLDEDLPLWAVLVEGTPEWRYAAWTVRSSPTLHAFAVADRAGGAIARLLTIPSGWAVELEPIQRVQMHPSEKPRTVAVLTIDAAGAANKRALFLLAEEQS